VKYSTSTAFRTALEARIRNHPPDHQSRIRKEIVFDRVLARLIERDSDVWIVKGGFALDVRFGNEARSTKDLDLFSIGDRNAAIEKMLAVSESPLSDYFDFEVRIKIRTTGEQPSNAASFHVSARLDGRRFEDVNVDMEIGETVSFETQRFRTQEFLVFAGIEPLAISLISLEQHLAEKLHAYSRHFSDDRENTRVKDLVDIMLICQFSPIVGTGLMNAIVATFGNQGASPPSHLAPPPSDWEHGYARLAEQVNLDPDLANGYVIARRFLNPVLARETHGSIWKPDSQAWVPTHSDQTAPLG